ncbi:MAG: FtsW/RodA/SpoVE family cell cycle protein [Actinomycetota bacterium]|nr:FtsW/RodA/SpoVE family cell cycle protein [Actinomycetota bacterium]
MTQPAVVPAAAPTRRNTELLLLLFAIAVSIAGYAAVTLTVTGEMPADLATHGLGLAAVLVVAHLVVRRVAPYADPLILPAVALLNGIGIVVIHRLDLAELTKEGKAATSPLTGQALGQLTWTAIGVALFVTVLALVRDHRLLARYTYTAMVVGLGLLLLPLVPGLGVTINGSRIWIRLAGLSFQPAEVAKIVLMVFFAGYLVAKRDVLALASRRFLGIDLPRARDLGPIAVVWGVSLAILVLERDLGTSVLFFASFVMLLYVATERRSWLIIGALMVSVGGWTAYQLFGHVRNRVDIWLHPFDDPTGRSFQLVQGLYSLADGGLLGTGLGQGRPDLVPYANTDFILTAIGEELGLTGLLAVLVLYLVLVERGIRTAIAARDTFGKLFAAGLSFILGLQVFVIVGGVTRLIPLTGLTTPFLSYGGSSLVANWALVALLLRISDIARRPAPAPAPPVAEAVTQVVRL